MTERGNEPFFIIRGVSKTFALPWSNPFKKRETVRALDSVSLEIPRGEVTCLLGPNGAGKTTLIKILASLVTPDSGEVRYDGGPMETKRKELQAKIGLVTPNERSFYWRLSGRENLLFFGRLHGFYGKELSAQVDRVLEEVGMAESARKPYRLYSAGMKQKVNIARALLGNPELLLLDEPAAHLDPIAREDFARFVREDLVARRGATVFLCTHDLEEARVLSRRIAVLDKGRLVARGTREELLSGSGSARALTLSYDGEAPRAWLERWKDVIEEAGDGVLRLSFNDGETSQAELVSSFAREGGLLKEAYRDGNELLDFIKRTTGAHA